MRCFWLLLLTTTRKKLAGLAKMKSETFREFGKYKTCKVCKRDRLRSSFYNHSNTKDGLFSTCKFCLSDIQKGIEVKPEPLSVGQRIKEYFEANYDKN